ncbi:MAG: RIP metalloprotease RseP [Lachnospiraceae bacterium]|nr:RIP metalloprotease RseP [Lachnospiraceae bacterium]
MRIIVAILIFSFIIIFHEMGHYLLARFCDVKVNEFQLGLGPRIFGIQRGETMFSLHVFPFGGACSMEGEDEESDDERAFNKKTVWQRMAIVFAGPFFNFILAFLLAVVIISLMGFDPPVVSDVMEGYPAQKAGIQSGDEIVALDKYKVHFYREISVYLFMHPGKEVQVTYSRDGEKQTTMLAPQYDKEAGRYVLGIQNNHVYEKGNPLQILQYGIYEIRYQVYLTFQSLKMLVTRQIAMDQVSGPVGIVKTIGDTYETSRQDGILYVIVNMLSISVLLSANLGVMNLLPIPALDGGRLLFYIIEVIRGKQMDERIEGYVHMVGFALLMLLMIVVLFNDVHKLILP